MYSFGLLCVLIAPIGALVCIFLKLLVLVPEAVLGRPRETPNKKTYKDQEDDDVEDDEAVDEAFDAWTDSVRQNEIQYGHICMLALFNIIIKYI